MISTHVLDTEHGRPRAGIEVALFRGDELVSRQVTNEDGRIPDLSGGQALGQGPYRLVFSVESGFFDQVSVTIDVDPAQHYHVPLLLSPYSCVIYRGS